MKHRFILALASISLFTLAACAARHLPPPAVLTAPAAPPPAVAAVLDDDDPLAASTGGAEEDEAAASAPAAHQHASPSAPATHQHASPSTLAAHQHVPIPDQAAARDEDRAPGSPLAQPLTEERALQLALQRNRALRAALAELGVARAQLVQAGLAPNPEIDFEVRVPDSPGAPLQADVGLEYNLSRLLLLPLRRGVARAELAAERVRVTGETLDLIYRTRLAFYAVQARQQQLALRTGMLRSLQASYEAALALHGAGNLSDLDLASERAAVEEARIAVAEAEGRLLDAREQLHLVLGLGSDETGWTLAGTLGEPPPELALPAAEEDRALAASLELGELRARLEAAGWRMDLAATEGRMPHLEFGFHGERDGRSWELGAHLSIGLPIFDHGQGRLLGARAERSTLEERYQAAAAAVRVALRTARNRVLSTARRARHYREALLPARQRALEETQLQYNAMQRGVFQLLAAQRMGLETASGYIDTLHAYWQARAALDQVLAGRHRGLQLGDSAPTSGARAAAAAGDAH